MGKRQPASPVEKETQKEPESISSPALVAERLARWFPDLSPETREQLVQLHGKLVKFNKAINLVSQLTLRTAESVHIADSVLASRLIEKNMTPDPTLYDVGSGNGFPGLVFAILYPKKRVILVERDTRKAEYLKIASSELKLTHVTVEMRSVDTLPSGTLGNVVLRGFATLSKSMLTLRKQTKVGGQIFHMKGDGFANELAQVPSQIFAVWSPSLLGQYRLPETSTELAVVLTRKIAE